MTHYRVHWVKQVLSPSLAPLPCVWWRVGRTTSFVIAGITQFAVGEIGGGIFRGFAPENWFVDFCKV